MVINMCEYNNVPKIRFKGFTDVWEQRKFGDYGTVSMCKRIFKNETSDSGDIPFYKIGTFGGKADAFISNEKYEYYKSKFSYPNKGDILLSASGTIGRIVEYTGEKAYFQDSNIVWLNHNEDIKNVFLKVLYPTIKWDGIEGSTIKRLYNSNFLNTCINIPNTLEQEKIGELFTNLDNLITLHQRKCDTLVNAKKSLLEKMFPKNSSNIPEIRFKEFTDVWEQRKLEDITQIVMGQSPDSINYTENSDDMVLIQGNADLNNGIVVPRIWSSQITKKSYPNDIIFTVRAPVGEIARNPYFATIGRGVASFKGNDFLYQSLIQKKENNYWNNISAGSTFDSINSDQLKNVIIDLPKNNLEQKKIGELFTNLDNLITLHQRKLEKLKNIKKSMLDKMFV